MPIPGTRVQFYPLDQYASQATRERNQNLRAIIEALGGVIVNPPEDRTATGDPAQFLAQMQARQDRSASAHGVVAEVTEPLTFADQLIITGHSGGDPVPVLLLSERLGRPDDEVLAQLAAFAGRLGGRAAVAIYDTPEQAEAHVTIFFDRIAGDTPTS